MHEKGYEEGCKVTITKNIISFKTIIESDDEMSEKLKKFQEKVKESRNSRKTERYSTENGRP